MRGFGDHRRSRYSKEKLLIFTEHRDTAEFLIRRLSGMGYAQQIAMIHGGLDYTERTAQVARFRAPAEQGGARFMVCTDAAGEGINLQFCWVMVNYDIPGIPPAWSSAWAVFIATARRRTRSSS